VQVLEKGVIREATEAKAAPAKNAGKERPKAQTPAAGK
jgi:hypothetical protein